MHVDLAHLGLLVLLEELALDVVERLVVVLAARLRLGTSRQQVMAFFLSLISKRSRLLRKRIIDVFLNDGWLQICHERFVHAVGVLVLVEHLAAAKGRRGGGRTGWEEASERDGRRVLNDGREVPHRWSADRRSKQGKGLVHVGGGDLIAAAART